MSVLCLSYPSDLSNTQWQQISAVLPEAKGSRTGRPRTYALRGIWNAIFYQARTCCAWRYLPHDLPPRKDVSDHFYRWRDGGTLERVYVLYENKCVFRLDAKPLPARRSLTPKPSRRRKKVGTTVTLQAIKSRGASDIWL